MINSKFEIDDMRFTPTTKETVKGVLGRWWKQEKYVNGEYLFIQRHFFPDILAATKTQVYDCFKTGSALLYFSKREANRAKWRASKEYRELIEHRKQLQINENKFCKLMCNATGVHEAIKNYLIQNDEAVSALRVMK